jgi:hypothetical protein
MRARRGGDEDVLREVSERGGETTGREGAGKEEMKET